MCARVAAGRARRRKFSIKLHENGGWLTRDEGRDAPIVIQIAAWYAAAYNRRQKSTTKCVFRIMCIAYTKTETTTPERASSRESKNIALLIRKICRSSTKTNEKSPRRIQDCVRNLFLNVRELKGVY